MPNNPGRIDGDYSTGEKESVTYVSQEEAQNMLSASDVKKGNSYLIMIAAAILIIMIVLALLLR